MFNNRVCIVTIMIFTLIFLSSIFWLYPYFKLQSSCSGCTTKIAKSVDEKIIINTLPVLQYMNDDRIVHPSVCYKKSCTDDGCKELDVLLDKARLEVPEMNPVVLKKMLDNKEDIILLDVRGWSKKVKYNIYTDGKSYKISRCDLEFKVLNQFPDKDVTIIVYSRLGARSLLAAQMMERLGFKSVYNLTAGVVGWARYGYPFKVDGKKIVNIDGAI